ncbi:MAG TPA: YceI family protein [Acetobacteraceae bacterium]|nr:YceI family protein [Acetobacteraceae bacterium]
MLPSLMSIMARGALLFGLTAIEIATPGRAGLIFTIDQRFGSINFSVDHLGLFSSQGKFDRFKGVLDIDPDHPERTTFRITIDAASLDMPWDEATAMLRTPEFFDVAAHPAITYTSSAVVPGAAQHYAISGKLQIRGVERPQALDALLLSRRVDPVRHVETADFTVTGRLKRSDFGMVARQVFISDTVTLTIHVRIELPYKADG